MDSLKINFYLQTENKKNKKCLILISVLWDAIRLRTTLNLAIAKDNWDKDRQQVKKQAMDSMRINGKLTEIKFSLNEFFTKYKVEHKKSPPIQDVKEVIKAVLEDRAPRKKADKKPEKQKSFFEYFKEFIKDTEKGNRLSGNGKRIQHSTITSYITTRNHLEEFLKSSKKDFNFDNIEDNFFQELSKYFSKKKLSNNSQGRSIKIIKTFLHYAFQKGYHNNLRFVKALKVLDQETVIIALTQEELESIENYKPTTVKLERVKDVFLVQIYSGLRFSDLDNLKPSNINYKERILTLNTVKTQENLIIPMTTKLQTILKKYHEKLPVISAQKYNDFLKELCKFAGIVTPIQVTKFIGNERFEDTKPKYELVSSHTARRTFITLTLKKGILPEMVMKVSGHKSRKSFQRYVRITQEEAVKQVQKAWEED